MNITVVARALLLTLALAAPAQAGPDAYAYTRAVPDEPRWCTSPCELPLTYVMPEPGIMLDPYLADCRIWVHRGHPERWDGVPVVVDRYLGLVKQRPALARGAYRWVLSDNDPSGRTQRLCVRFEYIPLQKLYDALDEHGDE